MKTVVYQSYRPVEVPGWIDRCMQTVRCWAAANGFDYRFVDDRLFEYAPAWYRQKVANDVLPVSDLARLVLAKEFLAGGFDRTVWVDADVAVFAPDRFAIEVTDGVAFCKEAWVGPGPGGGFTTSLRVNNSVSVFVQGNQFLDFYIDACRRIVAGRQRVGRWDVGTRFLTVLNEFLRFQLLPSVGLINPPMMADITGGSDDSLRTYMAGFGSPVFAANLCASARHARFTDLVLSDAVYEAVLDRCIGTGGEILNRHCPGHSAGQRGDTGRVEGKANG
jgi:hypothetical protein